jgi:RHH-type proline utilization regulon transcriptional repressor/proline dehydrogenase/delta 1-pyrroline-5-carboxylate dehydrogenase
MNTPLQTADTLQTIRTQLNAHYCANEYDVLQTLIATANLSEDDRKAISLSAADLVEQVRSQSAPTMMEKFLAEYGLSTKEGVALMCLAEALLRVPDEDTIDALIHDKVATGKWGPHLGQSPSSLINTATWALMITGKVIAPGSDKGVTTAVRGMVKRLGEPVVRTAVAQAMKELGRQFVLGRNIDEAISKAKKMEKKGYTYSYDMLGEGAKTDSDALRYLTAYATAITQLTAISTSTDIRKNPGISLKLSALYARYEYAKADQVLDVLVSRTTSLALQAKAGNLGFNIDAEEADRLDLSLDVIEAVLRHPALEGWDGFGVVVQAFCPRAPFVLDWLYSLAQKLDRKIMVRLVKGAYWDAEIKKAQVLGLEGYPVFTRKVNSDVSYIACARKLMDMRDRIYPQFATHNAHSVAAVLHLSDDLDSFEFQRLHGMGESLYEAVLEQQPVHCRIYAPVGAHKDLLAYLVRRLLENGANSSFVNQIVDPKIKAAVIAADPIGRVIMMGANVSSAIIPAPKDLYGSGRINSKGWDITRSDVVSALHRDIAAFDSHKWQASALVDGVASAMTHETLDMMNPSDRTDLVGHVSAAQPNDIQQAIQIAASAGGLWGKETPAHRADCLRKVGDLYEQHAPEFMALLMREAGKTLADAVGEIREAVDFARYYAKEIEGQSAASIGVGVVACISPWNFPLAIFSGQILAALAAGNTVIAKPADQTPLVAYRAVQLMHEAGIPVSALHLLPGSGAAVGEVIMKHPSIAGVCFTGSTLTAQRINRVISSTLSSSAPFIAETGGLNAMIVDSTALPEQVVRDVIASSFQSAGQRCSALRMLYIQEDVSAEIIHMLLGAMDELTIGNPRLLQTDVGPVIDEAARANIQSYIDRHFAEGRVLKSMPVPSEGLFVGPTVIRVKGIESLEREIFGPVLHIATFKADELDHVVSTINAQGYGLTFGLHTRVDTRVDRVINAVHAGNIYVNRNQIGAVVGTQPFGGEGMSGTGPKAGGPHYLKRLMALDGHTAYSAEMENLSDETPQFISQYVQDSQAILQSEIDALQGKSWAVGADRAGLLKKHLGELAGFEVNNEDPTHVMPGPTGELNRLTVVPRGIIVCTGVTDRQAIAFAYRALSEGNKVVLVSPNATKLMASSIKDGLPVAAIDGIVQCRCFSQVKGIDAVAVQAGESYIKLLKEALAKRERAILPVITNANAWERFVIERHLCIDTTAAGGNATLIASVE